MKADIAGEPEWSRYYSPMGYSTTCCSGIDSIGQTSDGGYVVAGYAGFSTGPSDAWLFKLGANGDVQWSKTYRGPQRGEEFFRAQQTFDGGYVAVGNTASFGYPPGHLSNGWVLKLDKNGNIVWQEAFGGQDISSIDQTRDGGFVVAGTVGVDNRADAWIFKLDREGNVVWQKAYEASTRTDAYSIQQTRDGGYIVAGHSSLGALILRLDRKGNILWQKTENGSGFTTHSVSETSDGGFIVSGRSDLGPFLLKLNAKGGTVWQTVYGVPNNFLYQVQETMNGGLIVAGSLATNCCGDQGWVLKLDRNGGISGCSIAGFATGIITSATSVVTSVQVLGVSTRAAVTDTSVAVTMAPIYLSIQCVSGQDRTQKGRGHLRV